MIFATAIAVIEMGKKAFDHARRFCASRKELARMARLWMYALIGMSTIAAFAELSGVPVPNMVTATIATLLGVAAVMLALAGAVGEKAELDAELHRVASVERSQISETQAQILAELGRMRGAERERDAVVAHMVDTMARVSVALQRNHDEIAALRSDIQERSDSVERLAVGLADLVKAVDHHVGVIDIMARDIEALETRCDQMREIKAAAGVLRASRDELLEHMATMMQDAVAKAYKTGREEGAHNPDPEVLRQMQWEAYTDVLEDLGGLTPPPAPSE